MKLPSFDQLPPEVQAIVLNVNPKRQRAPRSTADRAVKAVKFETPDEVRFARLLELKRAVEGGTMNDLLLRLLREGWKAEYERNRDWLNHLP